MVSVCGNVYGTSSNRPRDLSSRYRSSCSFHPLSSIHRRYVRRVQGTVRIYIVQVGTVAGRVRPVETDCNERRKAEPREVLKRDIKCGHFYVAQTFLETPISHYSRSVSHVCCVSLLVLWLHFNSILFRPTKWKNPKNYIRFSV